MALSVFVFFFNDTATTEIYTLSLHDALPISRQQLLQLVANRSGANQARGRFAQPFARLHDQAHHPARSEEHTSELQSRQYLVCRLLLEKKNTFNTMTCPEVVHAY